MDRVVISLAAYDLDVFFGFFFFFFYGRSACILVRLLICLPTFVLLPATRYTTNALYVTYII